MPHGYKEASGEVMWHSTRPRGTSETAQRVQVWGGRGRIQRRRGAQALLRSLTRRWLTGSLVDNAVARMVQDLILPGRRDRRTALRSQDAAWLATVRNRVN